MKLVLTNLYNVQVRAAGKPGKCRIQT